MMNEEKRSTRILRILASVRDSLDRIEYGKPASFHEINRLESLVYKLNLKLSRETYIAIDYI